MIRTIGMSVCLLVVGVRAMCGQVIAGAGTIPTGVREPAELLVDLYGEAVGAFALTNSFGLSPNFLGAAGATTYGGTGMWTNKRFVNHPFEVKAGYKYLDLSTGHKSRVSLDGKVTLFKSDKLGEAATQAAWQKTFDVATREDYNLAYSHRIGPAARYLTLGATGTVTSIQPASGVRRTAGKGAVGTTWKVNPNGKLAADYTFTNPVDHEDSFSFTAAQSVTNIRYQPTVIIVVGKHRLVAASILFPLPL